MLNQAILTLYNVSVGNYLSHNPLSFIAFFITNKKFKRKISKIPVDGFLKWTYKNTPREEAIDAGKKCKIRLLFFTKKMDNFVFPKIRV